MDKTDSGVPAHIHRSSPHKALGTPRALVRLCGGRVGGWGAGGRAGRDCGKRGVRVCGEQGVWRGIGGGVIGGLQGALDKAS